jgi:hypothetical protein
MLIAALAFAAPAFAQVTFTKDVAPIFYEHCVTCHRPGEVAPFSLLSYREARPWAKSIAQVVSAKKMPPWSGESDRLHFTNDNSLAQEEIDTILAWIAEGTKQGRPDDMPAAPVFAEGWKHGEPDYVLTMEPVAVPGDSEDFFPQQYLTIDIDEPKWISAIEFLPGDRRVTHHFQTTYNSPAGRRQVGAESAASTGILAIWTAGMQPFQFPEGVGRVVNPGTRVLVDAHYHPIGEDTVDQTRIGLHWGEGELKKEVATFTVANMGLRIPPGAAAHPEVAYHLFDRDMQILAFSPHLHVRGKAMRYDLYYPDGKKETLLDVPQYNYNWQWLYYPTAPVDVPAGSKLEVTAVCDNSAENPANPDPTKEIIYRGDTFNEMFVGFFEAIPKEGTYHQALSAKAKIASALAQHPAEQTFIVGGFLPFGLYLPEDGEGWLYLSQGLLMFTISLDDFDWDGKQLTVRTQFPTPEASATTTIIEAERADDGSLKGTLRYGIDSDNGMNVPMIAMPMTAAGA